MSRISVCCLLVFVCMAAAGAQTVHTVDMINLAFVDSVSGSNVTTITIGTTIQWNFISGGQHTATDTVGGTLFDSGLMTLANPTFQFTPTSLGTIPYLCNVHFACCNMSGTIIVLPPATLPGSGEDLGLSTAVNSSVVDTVETKQAAPGDTVLVLFDSPNDTFNLFGPLLVGQLFITGFPPLSPAGFPEVHIDLAATPGPVVIYNGTALGPLGPQGLAPAGLSFFFPFVPPGMVGFSFLFQGLSVTNTAANGFFAATDAKVIEFIP